MNPKFFTVLIFNVLLSSALSAQAQKIFYKKHVLELRAGIGASLFFGDLGGNFSDRKGGFLDLETKTIRYNLNFGAKFNFTNWLSVRSDLNIAKLIADDAHSNDELRKQRNLSFRSNISEISLSAELIFVNLMKVKQINALQSELYLFGGIGALNFNPQANLNGTWHDLQPLSTEGQGIIPGTRPYSKLTGVIPIGFGVRKVIGPNVVIGIELSMRKSYTDYIDDVSNNYYDAESIRMHRGDVAASLSDRSLDERHKAGIPRGNSAQNDNYSFIQLYLNYGVSKKELKRDNFSAKSKKTPKLKCPKF